MGAYIGHFFRQRDVLYLESLVSVKCGMQGEREMVRAGLMLVT